MQYPQRTCGLSKSLGEIHPPVGKELSVKRLGQNCPNLRISGVHVGSRETERDDLPSVIAGQMQLETMTPSYRTHSISGKSLEYLGRSV